MTNNIQYAAFDLDGTLLNDNKIITSKNLQALRHLNQDGVQVIIATGRGFSKADSLTEKIGFDKTMICNNGALIYHNNELVSTNYLAENIFEQILEIGKKYNLEPYLFVDDKDISIVIPNQIKKEQHLGSVNAVCEIAYFNELKNYTFNNILSCVFIDQIEVIERFRKDLLKKNFHISIHTIDAFMKGHRMLEVLNPVANKLSAIQKIIKVNGLLAFGDENNDIAMIEYADIGVAMKNASKPLKAVANHITNYDNNNDGVYHEIRRLKGDRRWNI